MHRSTLITVDQLIEQQHRFNIPIYQRLYVWGSDQIKILLDDLMTACESDKTIFYLGGTLVIEQGSNSGRGAVLDLIDGQQRFTTLWLLSIALERQVTLRRQNEINHLSDFRYVKFGDGVEPRIAFAIRPEVSRFFEALLRGEDIPPQPAIGALGQAIDEIEGYFDDSRDIDLSRLSDFIRHRVQLALTKVPAQTDLNKLFEVINNRGMQLQHHEILKAWLLGSLEGALEREVFGRMWDACAHMGDYVEKNLRTAAGIKLVPMFDSLQAKSDREALADPVVIRATLGPLCEAHSEQALTLAAILNGQGAEAESKANGVADEGYDSDEVRSIITFSMLLQHVLRIFLKQQGKPDIEKVLDKDLLQIFDSHWLITNNAPQERAAEVRAFIDLLWRCRYLFDKHVIKWVKDEDDEIHAIRMLRVNSSRGYQSLVRESRDANTAFALLQSMLYHSQQLTTQYWLTPLLNYLLECGSKGAHLYLKNLDNYLLCSCSEETLAPRSRRFLDEPWHGRLRLRDIGSSLAGNDGTGFSHYWFYKLEYILWERYAGDKGAAWQNFRMTAKNSVEHVSPQKAEKFDSNPVSNEVLDTFGNLALVARSVNSEYSNKPYVEKRARFHERNAVRVDSLKLALIYENPHWSDSLANSHRAQMIADYENYLKEVDLEVAKLRS